MADSAVGITIGITPSTPTETVVRGARTVPRGGVIGPLHIIVPSGQVGWVFDVVAGVD